MVSTTATDTNTAIYQKVIDLAQGLLHELGDELSSSDCTQSAEIPANQIFEIPNFPLPERIAPRLVSLGITHDLAEKLSDAFISKSRDLKLCMEEIVRSACMKLVSIPRCAGMMPLEAFQRRIRETHQHFQSTVAAWAKEAEDLVRTRLAAVNTAESQAPPTLDPAQPHSRKSKRQFKSVSLSSRHAILPIRTHPLRPPPPSKEYLPLFEFAFEKDRFPSREDKKHLARISGMTYRQVSVWVRALPHLLLLLLHTHMPHADQFALRSTP
ncbi:hypothetical protein BU17DRAFT_92959 [Hysterangium stoloniferum]|nr:hypothetical protein BU17DRAFT_92959 [Hysterangium stoloniferum]